MGSSTRTLVTIKKYLFDIPLITKIIMERIQVKRLPKQQQQ